MRVAHAKEDPRRAFSFSNLPMAVDACVALLLSSGTSAVMIRCRSRTVPHTVTRQKNASGLLVKECKQ